MTITFIGAGNVASHLAPAFVEAGHTIVCVYSRTLTSALLLGKNLKQLDISAESRRVKVTDDICQILPADIYIISVADDAISAIVDEWPAHCRDGVVAHTSGSIPMEALSSISKSYGVLYPLQTFTKNKKLQINQITCFVEANNEVTENILCRLCKDVFGHIEYLDSPQRKLVHLAAVFACNFSNHMVTLGYEILERNNISPNCIKPLLRETFQKLLEIHPHQAQTGPARRHDHHIIEEHLRLLSNDVSLQTLYQNISQSIKDRFK